MQTYSTEVDLTWLGDTLRMQARRATLHSGDVDLVPANLADLLRRFPDMIAADWESGAIAYVAKARRTPLLILRMVADLVSPERGEATANLALFEARAAEAMRVLLEDLADIVPLAAARSAMR
jgi:adenosylhomocysteine nucleosidase